MPPKIYFSDAEKRKDELKKKQRGGKPGKGAPTKVVKSSAARAVGGKLKGTRPVPNIRRGVRPEKSVDSNKTVQSGKVTIAKRVRAGNGKVNVNNKPAPKVTVTLTNKKAVATSPKTRRQSTLDTSLATARAIVANNKHPKQNDVRILLDSFNKKFINEARFIELLKTMLF